MENGSNLKNEELNVISGGSLGSGIEVGKWYTPLCQDRICLPDGSYDETYYYCKGTAENNQFVFAVYLRRITISGGESWHYSCDIVCGVMALVERYVSFRP